MHKSNGKLSNRFSEYPRFFLLPCVLFYSGLLMLKAASKLWNFSFSLRFMFCLPPNAPLVLLIFVVQTLLGNIAHGLFINQCKEEETNMQGPHASMGDSVHGTFKPLRGRTSKDD